MKNEKRLIDANALFHFLKEQREKETGAYSKGRNNGINVAIGAIRNEQICPTVYAVMLSDLEAWLYEIAMNNVGDKFDGDFSDAVEEIVNRLDGLRVFAAERRADDGSK